MSGRVPQSRKSTRGSKSYENRSKISGKRPLNRFEMEAPPPESVGTSAKKLRRSEESYNEIKVNETFGYRLLNFIAVFTALSESVVCKTCHSKVTFSESSKRGLGFKIVLSCENCDDIFIPNCPFIDNAFEINRRMIFAMRLLGIGLHGIEKFCAFMDLPRPIFHSFYDKLTRTILHATETVAKKSMLMAAQEEKALSLEKGQTDGLTVSGDGSWRKRGFSSLFGLVTLIGWFSGKVIDIVVKSKYCKTCEFWEKKVDTTEYEEWKTSHANECQANHEGSAGKMEVDAIIEMFQRSEQLHQVKYVNYIGDGDSKTFKGLLESQQVENSSVKKKECIDHVQKRMGTRLCKLKNAMKGLGEKGKLTAKLIDELSVYFGLAIRRNHNSIENMRREIWATLYHKLSTDEKPQHDKCPPGKDSWCKWQLAKATNKLAEFKHKPALPQMVFDAIKPIYEELSSDDLLKRCLGGYTQNSNESYNALIWSMAPKSVSSGKIIIDTASNIAVCTYNDGYSNLMKIMGELSITIGPNCYNYCLETDARRIKLSERSMTDAAKEARSSLKSTKKDQEEKNINEEGQLYGAGIAD
ncbi:uncharacterized protein LOC114945652 [Nylanderia fulva]|uniref:uncharacterized protein LOC114945652 n=1 Tax=Nylanderia fulva TaxID=613905 RepID=UPI0010FACF0B|nr:uncharacterized protein LOC114945652 [Nylanderia fulva]